MVLQQYCVFTQLRAPFLTAFKTAEKLAFRMKLCFCDNYMAAGVQIINYICIGA